MVALVGRAGRVPGPFSVAEPPGDRESHPHLSPGLGVRYVFRVGRIRFDLGVRPPYLQEIGAEHVTESEGGPEAGRTDVPISFHVAIGEAI